MSTTLSTPATAPAGLLSARPPRPLLYALLGFMVICWSLNFVISKFALRELPPVFVASFRTFLAGLLITPIYLWQRRHQPDQGHWTRRDVPILLFLGVMGTAVNQVFFVLGIGRTSVTHAAFLVSLTPIWVLLMAVARRQERLSSRRLLGLLAAAAGVVTLQLTPGRGAAQPSLLGDAFILLSSLTFSVYTVVGKGVTARLGSITVNSFGYVAGGLLLLPVTLWTGSHAPLAQASWVAWASVGYMALFSSVVSYLIYYYALTYVPASRVASLAYLQPVLGTLFAALLLGEQPAVAALLGGVLVLLGVIVTGRS